MKILQNSFVMLLLTLSTAAFSQTTSKPAIFSGKPDRLICSETTLANAFDFSEGQYINLTFSDNTIFSGKVISNIVKYSNLQTMTIQLTEYGSAVLHLSKQINADHTVNYVGRIMQNDASDGYMIEKNAGDYSFKKINTERILELCNQ